MVAFFVCLALVSLNVVAKTEMLLVAFGIWSSWLYLRYFQVIDDRRGDTSPAFAFHAFVPKVLQLRLCGHWELVLSHPTHPLISLQTLCAVFGGQFVASCCCCAHLPSRRPT